MACTNADIYYSIIHCYLTGDDESIYMQEMEKRGYTDIDSFRDNSIQSYYGNFATYTEYLQSLCESK